MATDTRMCKFYRFTETCIMNADNGYQEGYLFAFCRKGHRHCGCKRSGYVEYVTLHYQNMGDWPSNDLPGIACECNLLLGEEEWEIAFLQFGIVKVLGENMYFPEPLINNAQNSKRPTGR